MIDNFGFSPEENAVKDDVVQLFLGLHTLYPIYAKLRIELLTCNYFKDMEYTKDAIANAAIDLGRGLCKSKAKDFMDNFSLVEASMLSFSKQRNFLSNLIGENQPAIKSVDFAIMLIEEEVLAIKELSSKILETKNDNKG